MKNIITFIVLFFSVCVHAQIVRDTAFVTTGQKVIQLKESSTQVTTATGNYMYSSKAEIVAMVVDTIFNLNADSTLASISTSFTRPVGTFAGIGIPRGAEFSGTITVPDDSTFYFPAEGSGVLPTLLGTTEITGWTLHSGSIYKATVATGFNSLFLDRVKVPVSRFPDSSYIRVNSVTSTSVFSSDTLNDGTNWTGATLFMDFDSYAYQKRTITASSGAEITVNSALLNLTENDKFFIINKLETLDGANQYAWDDATNTLYLWTPDSVSPSNYTVEVSSDDNAFVIAGKSNVTIRGFNIFGYEGDAIAITGTATNIEIKNNAFTDNYASGVNLYDANTSYVDVKYNTISGSLGWGIKSMGSYHNFSNNTITNIGRSDNLGIDGFVDFLSSAVGVLGYPISNTTINNNVINSIGYIGILFYGQDVAVEQNKVYDFCLDRQDGGGIYTHKVENDNIIIQDNIVYNTTPAPQGVSGIYLDAITNDVSVIDNTVWNCYYGIQTNNLKGCTFTGNTLYGNSDQQFLTREFFADSNEAPNVISDNVMISLLTTPPNTIYPWARTIGDMYLTVNNNVIGQDRANPILYYETAPEGGGGEIYSWITIAQFAAKLTASNVGTTPIIPDYTKTELFYNASSAAVVQDLSGHTNWTDLSGNTVTSLTLQPFTSQVLNYSD